LRAALPTVIAIAGAALVAIGVVLFVFLISSSAESWLAPA
jgi:hypothetical protein